ncbi:MAG TPA: 5'/3'-nucleotidase SurE [Candidatus Acidoferrales bacterium]|jgi:5'-nucleotidase|nr:5'/3'-nucleotidase SurE [Candidatus Acidoferrales bacterium]
MQTRIRFAVAVILFFSFTIPAAGEQSPPAATPPPAFTILLTNDDGYDAPGLKALIEALRTAGDLYVSAPAENQSGKGHSILTTRDPIFVNEKKQPSGVTWYAVEAPPATCVRLAVEALLPRRPDIVISGINRGDNLGLASVYLSGTVGAAQEAALIGIPAIAVSMEGNKDEDYARTAAYMRQLVEQLREQKLLKTGLFLNVNAPSGEHKGVVLARLSRKPGKDKFERRESPSRRIYYWSAYRPFDKSDVDDEGTDLWAYQRGYIAVTPMILDVTDTKTFESWRVLEKKAAAAK